MPPPKLCGAEFGALAASGSPLPVLVDEVVGNVRVKQLKKFGGASRGQERIHAAKATLFKPLRPRKDADPIFLKQDVSHQSITE